MGYGAIYIAHNPRDGDNIYKVGKTDRKVEDRMKELTSATSNLGLYTTCAYFIVNDIDAAEQACHIRLKRYRVQENREYFEIPLSRLIQIVKKEVEQYSAMDYCPNIDIDESQDSNTIFATEMLKASRDNQNKLEKSYDEQFKNAVSKISDWTTLIRDKALQVSNELKDEDILKWEIPNEIDTEGIGSRFMTICSVTVLSRFSKEPLALWQSGIRRGIYGELDLSAAIGKPVISSSSLTDKEIEFVKWRELDDGRVGKISILAHIENAFPSSRDRGDSPIPKVIVSATPIRYDDYHQNFEEKHNSQKEYNEPLEAVEVFFSLVVENAKSPQYDVRSQNGTLRKSYGESQPKIRDQGKFELGLLEE
ncbi:MAG: GIY-YIG nuclease family protein [Thermodesulfovibrionia bacterium]|nr:GIY-YIG nuclease family protein [Thermodesulfovibrionia bacterium]